MSAHQQWCSDRVLTDQLHRHQMHSGDESWVNSQTPSQDSHSTTLNKNGTFKSLSFEALPARRKIPSTSIHLSLIAKQHSSITAEMVLPVIFKCSSKGNPNAGLSTVLSRKERKGRRRNESLRYTKDKWGNHSHRQRKQEWFAYPFVCQDEEEPIPSILRLVCAMWFEELPTAAMGKHSNM